ncbi:uncharacterized protein PRCAT00001083001 [Priceomyces carsonii]|uniref:uncharacterized protein n=1 Tax=Priceomyces carsonii TaxID=28549 RepID=UPI002ED987E0|nr:unnamed protein product [Priceomyces carsonii]
MDVPFPLFLKVKHLNLSEEEDKLIGDEYIVNVTLRHKIKDIKNLVWKNSEHFALRPLFLHLVYEERDLDDNECLSDILQTAQVIGESYQNVGLTIDYTLMHSPSVPRRDPGIEFFDLVVQWWDASGKYQESTFRESLYSSIDTIRDYMIEKSGGSLHSGNFKFLLTSTNEVINDNSLTLSQILKIDVTPMIPVIFKIVPVLGNTQRYLIKIESHFPSLQQGSNLFEINLRTTVKEFKDQIIYRMDHNSVARTFYDQISLYYNTHLIVSPYENDASCLYDILSSERERLQPGEVISINLEVSENLNGSGGVLSRDFWRDLRAPGRFEFLPAEGSNINTQTSRQGNRQSPRKFSPYEPTRIVLADGNEWNLTGESFDRIHSTGGNSKDLLVSQHDISPIIYDIKLNLENETQSASLSSSQCFIVDNSMHQPYLLLSPSGAARLNNTFQGSDKRSLMQQVKVLIHNDGQNAIDNTQHPQSNEGLGGNADAAGFITNISVSIIRGMISFLSRNLHVIIPNMFKVVFFVYVFGLNQILFKFWKQNIVIVLLLGVLYVLFYSNSFILDWIEERIWPENEDIGTVSRTVNILLRTTSSTLRFTQSLRIRLADNVIEALTNRLIKHSVSRTRDYEYLIKKRRWTFTVTDNLINLWKDIIIQILTLFPSLHSEIKNKLNEEKDIEMNELENLVNHLEDRMHEHLIRYNSKHSTDFQVTYHSSYRATKEELNYLDRNLDEDLGQDFDPHVMEKRYRLLIYCSRILESDFADFVKGFESDSREDHSAISEELPIEERDHQLDQHLLGLATGIQLHE